MRFWHKYGPAMILLGIAVVACVAMVFLGGNSDEPPRAVIGLQVLDAADSVEAVTFTPVFAEGHRWEEMTTFDMAYLDREADVWIGGHPEYEKIGMEPIVLKEKKIVILVQKKKKQ